MRDKQIDRLFDRFRQHGDMRALEQVFDQTAPELSRVAAGLVPTPELVEDLVQETYVIAIERAERFDAKRRLVPWLLGILVMHAHELRRQEHRELDPQRLREREVERPEEVAVAIEVRVALRRALDSLTQRDRLVLEPFLEKGESAAHIARSSGQAPGTVRMQIHRGLERLRKALPAGLATGAAATVLGGDRLARIRSEVLRAGAQRAAGLGAMAVTGTTTTFVGWSGTTQAILCAIVLAIMGLAAWFAWPKLGPDAPVEVARSAEPFAPEEPGKLLSEVATAAAEADAGTGSVRSPLSGSNEERSGSLASIAGRLVTFEGVPLTGVDVSLIEIPFELSQTLWAPQLEPLDTTLEFEIARALTDGEGRFRFDGATAMGSPFLAVDPGGPRGRLLRLPVSCTPGEVAEVGEIRLPHSSALEGRIVDEEGAPVAGARVRVVPLVESPELTQLLALRSGTRLGLVEDAAVEVMELPGSLARLLERAPVATTRTDAEGGFRLPSVPRGEVRVMIDAHGLEPYQARTLVMGIAGAPSDLGQLRLQRERELAIEIDEGAARETETEALQVLAGSPSGTTVMLRPARLEGRTWIAQGLPRDVEVVVAVRRKDGEAWTIGRAGERDRELRIALPAATSAIVRLVDPKRRPIPNARVRLDERPGLRSSPLGALASAADAPLLHPMDTPGTYRVDDIAPGRYGVIASASGYLPSSSALSLGQDADADEPFEIALRPAREKELELVGTAGQDVRGAIVTVVAGESWQALRKGLARERADLEGRVRLLIAQDEPRYAWIRHPAYLPSVVPLEPVEGLQRIELEEGCVLQLVIQSAQGDPLPGLVVQLTPTEVSIDLGRSATAVADAQGRVTFRRLLEGRYLVWVDDRLWGARAAWHEFGGSRAEGAASLVSGTVEVQRGKQAPTILTVPEKPGRFTNASLQGTLFVDGQPAEGMTVWAAPDQPLTRMQVFRSEVTGGRFRFDRLPQGRYSVSVGRSEHEPMRASLGMRSVEVKDGVSVRVDFDLRIYAARIEVHDASGVPVADAVVHVTPVEINKGGGTAFLRTGADGSALFEATRPGAFHVRAEHDNHGLGSAELLVGPHGSPSLALELSLGVPCAGEVILLSDDASDPRFAYMNLIRVDHSDAQLPAVELQFQDGRAPFRLTGLEPGAYQAMLWLTLDGGSAELATFELPPHGDEAIRLELRPAQPTGRAFGVMQGEPVPQPVLKESGDAQR